MEMRSGKGPLHIGDRAAYGTFPYPYLYMGGAHRTIAGSPYIDREIGPLPALQFYGGIAKGTIHFFIDLSLHHDD